MIDRTANEFKLVARIDLIEDDSGAYAHPAIVSDWLYFRSGSDVRCYSLR